MYETLEIPRFVGQTISEAGEVGGGEWWDEGSIDFEKMYTLYILEMHIGKKRILHNHFSPLSKKIHTCSAG